MDTVNRGSLRDGGLIERIRIKNNVSKKKQNLSMGAEPCGRRLI